MSTKEVAKPYPDTWHVVTYNNEYRSGTSKMDVKDEQAKYYILEKYSYDNSSSSGNRYDFNEFEVFDANFNTAYIEVDGVTLKDFTTEIWDRSGVNAKQIGFTIQDKVGVEKKEWFKVSGIYGFVHCIKLMQQLSKYYSWNEYELAQKLSKQSRQILKLRIDNLKLKLYKDGVEEVKDNIKKLYQILFKTEAEAGIKHFLKAETITDKDIALAFGTTQKRVREIRRSLDS